MNKVQKKYIIITSTYRWGRGSFDTYTEGTLEELVKHFKYTLEVGKSWEHEKGNKKINLEPKTIESLITNLNNAKSNAAANGSSNVHYDLKS